jgi:hypothetical protein
MSREGAARADIVSTRIDGSARAAVSAAGAEASLQMTALTCQAIDLNRDPYLGAEGKLDDRGGNLCGCPEATNACKAVSAALEPPTPLEAAPE